MLGAPFLAAGDIVSREDIKRQLGVGTATLRDHLRDYKDPFEPSDPAPVTTVPGIDFELFVLCRQESRREAPHT